jgi:hypothetical protein
MTGDTAPDRAAPGRAPIRSKTLATWLAVFGGSLGLHRFYLYGWRDWAGWLHPLPALVGLVGVVRMRNLGQDDIASWALIPLLGFTLSAGFLAAIVIGLTPDAKWARLHGRRQGEPEVEPEALEADERTGWAPVLGVIAALIVGGVVLMGTIAFSGQKYFEYQALQQAGR